MRLSGQVIHTGNSSMEVAVRMEAIEKDGSEETIMLGRFCMVARDAWTGKSKKVNPLILETLEDRTLFNIGESMHLNVSLTCDFLLIVGLSPQRPAALDCSALPEPRPAHFLRVRGTPLPLPQIWKRRAYQERFGAAGNRDRLDGRYSSRKDNGYVSSGAEVSPASLQSWATQLSVFV